MNTGRTLETFLRCDGRKLDAFGGPCSRSQKPFGAFMTSLSNEEKRRIIMMGRILLKQTLGSC
jgi:hypothetical protein